VRESFGDRLRASRQRLRRRGQKLTQDDLARAVGVERNTVSRWENGGMLPKDPAVIASLAGVLEVTADWLIGGDRAGVPFTELREGVAGQYLDPAAAELPERARAVALGYLDRLRGSGCSPDQVRGAEALLLAGARNRVSSRRFEDRDDDTICADVDASWDVVVRIFRREGIRP
jgi:transcriptional regulator with XRE-family HTH domain